MIAKGFVHVGVIEAAAEGNDVLDIILGMLPEEGMGGDVIARVGASFATFLPEHVFIHVPPFRVVDVVMVFQVGPGLVPLFLEVSVVFRHLLPHRPRLFDVPGEFESNHIGLAVGLDEVIDHLAGL